MTEVHSQTLKTLMHGSAAVICEIVEAKGSSPRKTGAQMLVDNSGRTWGSVGGGALENLCIKKALELHKTKQGYVQEFDLASALEDGSSMICGGDVTIEFTYLDTQDAVSAYFGEEEKPIKVYLFGGGHVGTELVPVLEHLRFDVIVLDDRPEFASADRHPKAGQCILCDYENIEKYVSIQPEDYVAVMTHGHKNDRNVLLQCMRKHPSYIGCIGSRNKVAATHQFLRENGITQEDIDRLHSPIGIDLLGDTPEEIAISIAAQLIRHRAENARKG